MERTSKIITYLLLAACVAIPFMISLISRVIADASADKNGHGIDGTGAALATGMFIKVLQIAGYVACLALWIYSIVRVFKSGMPKWVPGEQKGQKVRVKYTVPISFRLK